MSNEGFYSGLQKKLEEAASQAAKLGSSAIQTLSAEDKDVKKVEESPQEWERLKKIENRFVPLARAYKAIQSKQEQLEKIVTENTTIKELKTPEQFAEFERLVKQSNQSFESEREITKLVNQISDLKQAHDQDLNTNSDMYAAMQAKLVSREEEINRLKHKLSKIESTSTPTKGSELGDSTRNSAESLPELVIQPPKKADDLQMKLESELNTSTALKSRLKDLVAENDKAVENVKALEKANKTKDSTISELRVQVQSLVNEIAEMSVDNSKIAEMESKIVSLQSCVTALEGQKKTLESKIKDILQEDSNKISTLEAKNLEITKAIEEQDRLLKKANEASPDVINDNSRYEELETQIEDLKANIVALEAERNSLQTKIKEQSIKEAENLAKMEAKCLEITGKLEEKENLFKVAEKNNRNALSKLENLLNESQSSNSPNLLSDGEKSEAQRTDISLQVDVNNAEKFNLVSLEKKIEELQNSINSLETEKVALEAKIEDILEKEARKISTLEGEKSKITSELNEAKRVLNEIREEKTSTDETLNSSSPKTSELELKLEELQTNVAALDKEKKQLQDILSQESGKISGLESKNEALTTELQEKARLLEKSSSELEKSIAEVGELQEQLTSLNLKLTEESEKKTKSIMLLRNSKNRILKLEGDLRTKESELATAAEKLEEKLKALTAADSSSAEKGKTILSLNAQIDELQKRLSQLQLIASQVDNVNSELLKEKEKNLELKKEQEALLEKVKVNQKDTIELLEKANKEMGIEIEQLRSRIQHAEERTEIIDSELATSKSLFESKCVESDQLKTTLSELEVKIFEKGQEIAKLGEEKGFLEQSAKQNIRQTNDAKQKLEVAMQELDATKKELSALAARCDKGDEENRRLLSELTEIRSAQASSLQKDSDVLQKAAVDQIKIRELEEKIQLLCREKVDWIGEKDTLMQDFRMREMQLKNLNKALKEELRKISKSGSVSPSAVGSPIMSRAESMEIQSATSNIIPVPNSMRRPSSSSKGPMPDPEPEYLKNVVLKFLDTSKKSQRVQLLGVLAMLLKFTPEELNQARKYL